MAFAILSYISGITYVLAAMTVTSRFLFALARDHGIPFAKILAKTDKHKEPWVASLAIVLTMYLGTLAWFLNEANWYNLLLASGFWLIDIAYVRRPEWSICSHC
jgi:amino acid transporter